MKLLAATIVYLGISAVLAAGVIAMMHGRPVLLIASFLIYLAVFAKVGCATHD
jgi:hypothetical protein